MKHNSCVHNIPSHLIPWLKCAQVGRDRRYKKIVFTINTVMQYGPKSTYIDETQVNLGPLTLWFEQLF